VMSTDVQVAFVTVRALQDRGVPSATIFLSLLAPTARRLGDMWLSDQCSFADVTMGLVRLQQIMRGLSASVPRLTHRSHRQPSILLMRYANEQHTLGLSVVREMFQDAGWRTDLVTISRSDEAGQLLEDEWYDVVGVSLSNDDLLGPLASAISLLRRRSQNQAISVLVGGAAFNGQPGRGALVGADGAPEDGREAVRLANVLTGMEAAEVTGQS
jgi:MerR family transcriptional regulator, light-induced transcriptional regulator